MTGELAVEALPKSYSRFHGIFNVAESASAVALSPTTHLHSPISIVWAPPNTLDSTSVVGGGASVHLILGGGALSKIAPRVIGIVPIYVVDLTKWEAAGNVKKREPVSPFTSSEESNSYVPLSNWAPCYGANWSSVVETDLPSKHPSFRIVVQNFLEFCLCYAHNCLVRNCGLRAKYSTGTPI